ncbi:MAG: 50S ribosomal protein L13 [bacterium]
MKAKKVVVSTQVVDAAGKTPGRLAVTIANHLIGKRKIGYVPYMETGDRVIVKNVKEMRFTGQKLENKIYYHHSGYPGGLKEKKMKVLFLSKPEEVLRKAVIGMLPMNKLRAKVIKRLLFE